MTPGPLRTGGDRTRAAIAAWCRALPASVYDLRLPSRGGPAVLIRSGAARVVLAFAATPAGKAMASRARADLAGLPAELEVLEPPRGTWLATLRARRLADGEGA